MKARKTAKRASAVGGGACVGLVLGGLLVTRMLPPWAPLAWRPGRVPKVRQPLA
ncbi:hypothetical protein FHT40_005793 [Mycolicibacterium sp. BK556]|uniref:hypothetical protein n=1 Tax=Mycobacteriaceae TaxID=1762 RepID=UPI0010D141A3|nr:MULTISPECIES: hypothetical protein [Mycobacteriaceae]MBB3606104.1 hypothetical protein [Mycolicibacterium sp. BK556]MBB3632681.1 hypothetical protein [Mycolicibacterium sp. BK607]MBB3754030.1 hypothetical protein [Mycolicibacterium sp. BK634]TDO17994.1 hypothetical protein EV580_1173 [Mycobacterium sp. BK086]